MKFNLNAQIFSGVRQVDRLIFTKHLAVMIKSGIPLNDAISTLQDQSQNPAFKKILKQILADISNGQTLTTALTKHPQAFNSLYLSLIGIGEKSGNLEANLEYLAEQLKKSYEFKKKVQGALLYPEIILGATFLMGMGLSIFVLPSLVDLFKSLEVKLPLSTIILLTFAEIMKNYGLIILAFLITLVVGFKLLIGTKKFKPKWHYFVLSLPFFGPLIKNIELTSICRDLSIMLKSGLTITDTLTTQKNATENLVFREYLNDLLKSIERGQKLSVEIASKKFKFFPEIMAKMIEVGENTGKLEEIFLYLGNFFEEEVEDTSKNISTVLEPLLLLVIGIVVAFVAFAIVSPIYQLTGSIKK